MSMSLKEGWAWPTVSKKAHYFPEDDLRSFCNSYLFSGEREPGNDTSPDNCRACIKILDAQKKRQIKEAAKSAIGKAVA